MNREISPAENGNMANEPQATTRRPVVLDRSSGGPVIARPEDPILITGANGFIGSWVVRTLLARGFRNIRCLARFESSSPNLDRIRAEFDAPDLQFVYGNLLSRTTCNEAAKGAVVIYHLAA